MNALRPTTLACGAAMLCACSYDTSRLRGHPDAADVVDAVVVPDVQDLQDAPAIDTVDVGTDALSETGVEDTVDVPVETGSDATDATDAAPNMCTTRPAPNATDVGNVLGETTIVVGDTTGSPSMLDPPMQAPNCPFDYASMPAPENVYRYVVQQGPSLMASTDAPTCAGVFDTVVYIRTSCDASNGSTVACDDDDNVLSACSDPTSGLASSASAGALTPGDVVYVVVDGFAGHAGRFRLALAENGLLNAPPPTAAMAGIPVADRCSCTDSLETMTDAVSFPDVSDTVNSADGTTLVAPGDSIQGMHSVMLARVAGAGLRFRLASNQLSAGSGCAAASAIVDLVVDGVVAHSFVIDASTPVGTDVRALFETFTAYPLTGSNISIALRVRSVSPVSCTGGFVIDANTAGALTLLGST